MDLKPAEMEEKIFTLQRKPCDVKLLCHTHATRSHGTLDAGPCGRSREIISIFISLSLMKQISLMFLFVDSYQSGFSSFYVYYDAKYFFFKNNKHFPNNKPLKKG